ncbi:uncharacterized protein B0J16DRAFT_118813 [Fusarium flagelliforme]|uniref:Uncharacterized protein n=1 Tax=Fusarium flagelliforme TaxID=2675880 RepID=A0A395MQW2_9HYPO|nr:uncharacterized protein B0J16DRAFT_118813 [Fusarium flagelliforme]KAH7189656.1 hypothetical protein B0J16DRAFT_118813 [Fusarium flagelliforme]RFN50302.1 hypothetical protein FIE12Z_5482 [Fusarium flagelliforme]
MSSPIETEGHSDTRSVSSIDSFDPPPTIETETITQKQALEEMGDLVHQLYDPEICQHPEIYQETLRPQIAKLVMDDHILSVLPKDLKVQISRWCALYQRNWCPLVSRFLNHTVEECQYMVEISNRLKDMEWTDVGSDVLRMYVALLKPLRKGLPEAERRDVINTVREGLMTFADIYDKKIGAMDGEEDELAD